MGVFKTIKHKIINSNIYIFDIACKLKNRKSEQMVKTILKELKGIDPIEEYWTFKDVIEPLLQTKQYLSFASCAAESLHYGHINVLYEYAGINKKVNPLLFPAMEHAVAYAHIKIRKDEELERDLSFVYQSKYRKDEIHERNPWKPVFCIGPYIHYAHNSYSDNKMRELKKELGKTLTVFAGHLLENEAKDFNDHELVDFVMQYAKENSYDTVLVSVYFCDTDKSLYKEFERKGAKLVSAGFREDAQFIHRLKTILTLSDMIVANSLGTPPGFCYYLDIPYVMIQKSIAPVEESVMYGVPIDTEHHMVNARRMEYLTTLLVKNESEQVIYDHLYDYYSGEKELLKTKEEMTAIIKVMEKILRYSKGFYNRYNEATKKVLQEFRKDAQSIEYRMLKEALGDIKKC